MSVTSSILESPSPVSSTPLTANYLINIPGPLLKKTPSDFPYLGDSYIQASPSSRISAWLPATQLKLLSTGPRPCIHRPAAAQLPAATGKPGGVRWVWGDNVLLAHSFPPSVPDDNPSPTPLSFSPDTPSQGQALGDSLVFCVPAL